MELPINRAAESMTAVDAIYSRRSVRNYTKRKVDLQTVNKILDAAVQAPSAMNTQPWAFVIVQDPVVLHEISEKSKEFISASVDVSNRSDHFAQLLLDPKFDIFYGATTLVVICSKKGGFWSTEDCSLAGENLMLASTALGLGTCTIGFARDVLATKAFREKLSIPDDYVPILPIVVGYPASGTPRPERKPAMVLNWLGEKT